MSERSDREAPMFPTSLNQRWRDGATAFGAWMALREPLLAEAAGLAGFDYVVVDMQHGIADYTDAVAMVGAVARTPAVPIVRVPSNEPGIIGRVLDAGALGVIIPLVNSADEARRATEACRFPPNGARSSGPLVARVRHGQDYQAVVDAEVACIPMIETRQAIDNVEEILAVPGIDAVYIGPNDLSLSYGLAPSVDHEGDPFNGALARVVESCERHGIVPGIHANAGLAAKRHAVGFRMITVGYDAAPVFAALNANLTAARAAVSRNASE
jgi:4-hydroxy-2-oxoheptanedioate aldolase